MLKIAIILNLLILLSLFGMSLIVSTWKEEGDEGGFPKILVAAQKLFPPPLSAKSGKDVLVGFPDF